MIKTVLLAGASALASAPFALAEEAPSGVAPTPLETIIVIGRVPDAATLETSVDPMLEGRLATLDDLFRGTPGVQLEPVFGGIDHPRFSIRGSGLQRGTQPAGRGVELRLDGVPITYADTSFDFVEWIDPLMFESVSVYRGGRGALAGGGALGGVVDFQGRRGEGPLSALGRVEAGSFEFLRGQAAVSGGNDSAGGFATATWFSQDGFREHNEQEALRAYGRFETQLSPILSARASFLYADSELELPGPQTLAQVEAGSTAAQPFNISGDWRRFSERVRGAAGLGFDFGARSLDLDAAFMATDVEFRRRDVQVENNEDWALAARYWDDSLSKRIGWGANVVMQRNDRRQQQFFNGGGTPPTFAGARGDQWADNDLEATRLTAQALARLDVADDLTVDIAAGWDWHGRDIDDRFASREERPSATLDADYDGFNGLALVSWEATAGLTLFTGVSHVIEPPTYDVLLINRSGTPGPMNALLNGDDPRRPVIRDLEEQQALTWEAGLRGALGPVRADITVYRAWLEGEIVSTTDAVTQNVTSVGNADQTRRWGVEAAVNTRLASDLFQNGDVLRFGADWTFTDARFDDDATFGDNQLPIVVKHLVEGRLAYAAGGFSAEAFFTAAPDGGFADYANTLQADGYFTLGARASLEIGPVLFFVEGRNVTDERYVSSVIGARNNLNGMDNAIFAPGEPAAFTIGVQGKF